MTHDVYLMWHGITLFSSLGRVEGWSDSPLTDEACEQAKAAGRTYFAGRGIVPSVCFSSMSERACDTLELAWEAAFGTPAHYTRLKGLKDLNCAIFEGKDTSLVPPIPYGDFFVRYGGESARAAGERLHQTLLNLPIPPEAYSVLVSTHQIVCAELCATWDEDLAARVIAAPACSVLHLTLDEATGKLAFVDLYLLED